MVELFKGTYALNIGLQYTNITYSIDTNHEDSNEPY